MKQRNIWDRLDRGLDAVRRAKEALERSGLYRFPDSQKSYPVSQASREPAVPPAPREKPVLYGPTTWKSLRGIFKIIGGGFLTLAGLGVTVAAFFLPPLLVFTAAFLAGGGCLLGAGISDLARVKRFELYRRLLGDKTSISLAALAGEIEKPVKYVRRDLRKMFRQGFFLEGHLDHEETMLLTSNETYRAFEENRLLLAQKQREAIAEKAESAQKQPSPVQEILDKGSDFLIQLRRCNDRIPGQEVSGKISRMELLVDSIFDRLEAHPEVAPDLTRLLDYYLPLAVKLLNAYADMDDQPVQGETITASKREIETTLDTLNTAFEKLLDQVFQDTALDVSSDITVLNTMLAQEGLTEDELTKLRKQK